MSQEASRIASLLKEERSFPPPASFKTSANASDPAIYDRATRDPEGWWAEQADQFEWYRRWDKVLDWDAPWAKWFVGAKTNMSVNCLDRHVKTWRRNKVAFYFEGEPGDSYAWTYAELYREVNKFANSLKALGVKKGDVVTIYLGMIPELPIAMLACARIGAPHSVVFGGFSSESLADRINDSAAKILITADGGWRRGHTVPLKANSDEALKSTSTVEKVIVVKRTGQEIPMEAGRDVWWHDLVASAPHYCEPEQMDAEDMLYLLYTSGTTGKPKGIIHTTGGYMVGTAATHKLIFDMKEEDIFWCSADIGWVTGHSYIVYGPLANGTTSIIYEGSPDFPDWSRWWHLIEKYRVTVLYTAPTAIRAFMRQGAQWLEKSDLTSLRLLGSVGEPINPEAWIWYYEHVGAKRCPIVDTWWQTETGMILITPLPGISTLKPGSASRPFPTVEADVLDESGQPVPPGEGAGYLVVRNPWPAMLRGIYGDPERYQQQYWSRYPGVYFTGDGAKRDTDGNFWLLGRVDDVMNVSGHRLSTMEIESALVDHRDVAEAAVIGKDHPVKGQAVAAFVTLKAGVEPTEEKAKELKAHVATKIGAIARPDDLFFTAELPKTRSGKIMRRLLRDIAEGRMLGDTTTLADPNVVRSLRDQYQSSEG
jgi:acetyl-CoA synthetase